MTRRTTKTFAPRGAPSPALEAPGPLSTRVDTATHTIDCEGSSNCSCGATGPRRAGARPPRGGGGKHVPSALEPGVSPPSTFSESESGTGVYLNSKSSEPNPEESGSDEPITKVEAGRHAYESLIALCRTDPDAFNEFVLRDEETGERIEQSPIHVEMQSAITEHGFVVILAHPESGKTQQIGVGRTLFELGRNPNLRTVYLNNGQDGAKKTLSATKKYIERSQELRAVFPKLLPGNMWREDAITIEREGYSKDPSIYCIGFHGNILGARIDWAVIDDLLDYENTRTARNRKDTEAWLKRTFLTRLSAHARAAFLTNAWHEADLSVTLPQEGWHRLVYPVLDAAGQSTWPSKWPLWRIRKVRARGELEFARSYLCKPRDPGAESFGAEALAAALLRGKGYGLVEFLEESDIPVGGLLVSGVDLGASKKMTGGETSIGSVLHYPHGTKQLVGLRAGRWSGRKILENLAEVGQALGGVIIVENNGVQQYIVDLSQEEGEHYEIPVPVLPFYTGKNKRDVDLGVDAMGAEFEAKRWLLPSGRSGPIADDSPRGPDVPKQVAKLIEELSAYSPNTHPGDRVMSVWMARTWGVQRLARLRRGRGKGGVSVSVIG